MLSIWEGGNRLFEFSIGLQLMAHGQGFVIQFQLGGWFSGGLALANASHQ
jgi:hypothetical protein